MTVFFTNIIDALVQSELNLGKILFEDGMGVSTKTAKKYLKLSVPLKSRQYTEFKKTVKNASQRTDATLAVQIMGEMANLLEAIETDSEYTMPGIKYGCHLGMIEAAKHAGVDPNELELGVNPLHYSISFIEAASLPHRRFTHDPLSWPTILSAFPYNVVPQVESYYCIEVSEKSGLNLETDSRYSEVIKESILGIMAAMYLDLEQYILSNDMDINFFWEFVNKAWGQANPSAFFFTFLRNSSDFSSHEEFYKALSERFRGMDLDSVKTNYKRWCKTGSLKNEQWIKIAGADDEINEEYLFLRLSFLLAKLIVNVRRVGSLSVPNYNAEDFQRDLMRWCEVIEKELPFESWQPFQTAS